MTRRSPNQHSSPTNPDIDDSKMSSSTNAVFDSTGTRADGTIFEESTKAGSPLTEAEMLLGALRNVIISFIRPADGEHKQDANQDVLGTDGEEFLDALQKFMLSFLRSQQGPKGGIEVELEEEGISMSETESEGTADDDLSPNDVTDVASEMELSPDRSAPEENASDEGLRSILSYNNEPPIDISNAESEVTLDENLSDKDAADVAPSTDSPPDRSVVEDNMRLFPSPAPLGSVVSFEASPSNSDTEIAERRKLPFIEKALHALREHVFNTMPIRLLRFKPDGSKLQITLIERGEIYAHIASNLVRSTNFLQLYREIGRKRLEHRRLSRRPVDEAELMKLSIGKYCKYAILSHTWLRGELREVTYEDWIRGEFDPQQPGYRKLVNFCKIAWKEYEVAFGWMDTICINKDSSTELDESIRSMYKWYEGAHVCITYLADTVTLSNMPKDTWFTRGWTLQELFAPSNIKFYNADWDKFVDSLESDKDNSIIMKKIEEVTTITAGELKLAQHMFNIPISRRMQMAAERQVTREEDSAYSLMGIFNVSIATAYGEGGERAFSRLLQAVLNSTSYGIADIFNWAGPRHSQLSTLLPSSLQRYLDRSSPLGPRYIKAKPVEPIMLTHLGLRITILLMPAISIEHAARAPWRDYHAIADISYHPDSIMFRDDTDVCKSYSVLDATTDRISHNNTWNNTKQLALGVLNIGGGHDKAIRVPRHCLAVAVTCILDRLKKVATKAPVTFRLNSIGDPDTSWNDFYLIERAELESHGMKLGTLVL
ncbi:hypothetical protein BJ912DRAFT_1040032 [Pholiota molesta]|nr:hypothetical protein BJ912DRAFT_1040032 [Pholiota molesta]